MADVVTQHDILSLVSPRTAAALTSIVAGGGADNVAITGVAIDRAARGLPRTAALTFAFTAVLAAGATLTLKGVTIQHSADGATWTDYSAYADPGVVATGPAGGGTVTGQVTIGLRMSGAMQFVRFVFTPDLSAANTDTAIVAAVAVLAGFDRLPAP